MELKKEPLVATSESDCELTNTRWHDYIAIYETDVVRNSPCCASNGAILKRTAKIRVVELTYT